MIARLLTPLLPLMSSDAEFFEARIRPLLAETCLPCHDSTAMGGLRMDSREALLAGGVSGPAVDLDDPDASLLMRAVRHEAKGLEMPWDADPLTESEQRDLADWLQRGIPWPSSDASDPDEEPSHEEHPLFLALRNPSRPSVDNESWVRNDVDRFVMSRWQAEGITPAETATPQDLLRRACFDLTGLPPSSAQAESFQDSEDDRFTALVDELLASPHYGEKQGRRWLDVVRYAEDDPRSLAKDRSGKEVYPTAYVYRDWVIQAFQDDRPFDEFVKLQLAADLWIDERPHEDLAALGLLGGGRWFYDTADPRRARADEWNDRVDVITRGFLGLSVACARCHDHKADPITTQDYYALAGVFANTEYHEYPLRPAQEVEAFQKKKEHLETLKKVRKEFRRSQSDQIARLMTAQTSRFLMAAWKSLGGGADRLDEVAAEDKLDLELLRRWAEFLDQASPDDPFLGEWKRGATEDAKEEAVQELADAFQRELFDLLDAQAKLEKKNEHRIANGTPAPDERKPMPYPNDFESFFDEHQIELESLSRERMRLWFDIYDYRYDSAKNEYEWGVLAVGDWALERHLGGLVRDHLEGLETQIEELEKELDPPLPFVMGARDRSPEEIRDLDVFVRGNPYQPGDPAPRRFLAALVGDEAKPFQEGSGRRELADAIVAQPLMDRVIVNRVWRWHFGRGLVEPPDNFGPSGSPPSHPDLLEHLASWFVAHGRSLKALHRYVMDSSTYRLAAKPRQDDDDLRQPHPWFARGVARRLDAEEIRDSLLAVSGQLDPNVGGPSKPLSDEDHVRRTVYGTISRHELDPFLRVFDFPDAGLSASTRFTTQGPQQHLFFLNSEWVRSSADGVVGQVLGEETAPKDLARSTKLRNGSSGDLAALERSMTERDPDVSKLRKLFVIVFGRSPDPMELDIARQFLRQQSDQSARDRWHELAHGMLSSAEFRTVH